MRTTGSPEALLPSLRQRVHELDPELAMANVRTMDQWISNSAAQPRLNSMLLGVFALLALLIAGIGIYGVLAYSVSQRTREIGLRMAIGAQPGNVVLLVVGQGLKMALMGIGVGLLTALAMGRVVASLLYGVPARDPMTYCAVAVVLSLVALVACAVPARRAARIDPIIALRQE